jgi:3-oxoacyl-[acyl-carrier-protein] synthase III
MNRMGSTILSMGHYAPQRRVLNAELEASLGLEAGWIERRTGIRERRYAAADEALSDMAVAAGEAALQKLGFDRKWIGLVILATSTPDHLLPPSAPLVAHRLGLTGAGAIDMAGACAGFIHALLYADSFAKLQQKPVLVIAANLLSRRTNFSERASSIIFADAAGAAVVAPSDRPDAGVRGVHLTSDGGVYDLIKIPAGGSRKPFAQVVDPVETLMHIRDGRAVFSRAVDIMVSSSITALEQAKLKLDDIAACVPHQANARIITAVQKKLHVSDDKILSSVAEFGNSSAATIPLTLSLAAASRAFRASDRILMCAAGAGMTGGALVYQF